jgi:hypothetical protein
MSTRMPSWMPARTRRGPGDGAGAGEAEAADHGGVDGALGEQGCAGVFGRELAGAQGLPDALAAQGVDEVAGVAADQQAGGAAEAATVQAERQGPAAHRADLLGVGEALGVAGEEVIQQAAQVGAASRVVVVGALVDADVGEAVDGGEQPAVAAGEVAFEVVFADAGLGGAASCRYTVAATPSWAPRG